MTSRRPDPIAFHPQFLSIHAADVGWTRKTFALGMHLACLALFGVLVVWPVVEPIASGELAREFKPLLQAWAGWMARLQSLRP
jgi:hypothetical protein